MCLYTGNLPPERFHLPRRGTVHPRLSARQALIELIFLRPRGIQSIFSSLLGVFDCLKGPATGTPAWRSGLQTTMVGGLAAATAFLLAKLISR